MEIRARSPSLYPSRSHSAVLTAGRSRPSSPPTSLTCSRTGRAPPALHDGEPRRAPARPAGAPLYYAEQIAKKIRSASYVALAAALLASAHGTVDGRAKIRSRRRLRQPSPVLGAAPPTSPSGSCTGAAEEVVDGAMTSATNAEPMQFFGAGGHQLLVPGRASRVAGGESGAWDARPRSSAGLLASSPGALRTRSGGC
jgi:hypothetical protein